MNVCIFVLFYRRVVICLTRPQNWMVSSLWNNASLYSDEFMLSEPCTRVLSPTWTRCETPLLLLTQSFSLSLTQSSLCYTVLEFLKEPKSVELEFSVYTLLKNDLFRPIRGERNRLCYSWVCLRLVCGGIGFVLNFNLRDRREAQIAYNRKHLPWNCGEVGNGCVLRFVPSFIENRTQSIEISSIHGIGSHKTVYRS